MALTIISVWSVFCRWEWKSSSDEVTVTPVDDMQQQFSESPVVISAETTGSKKVLVFSQKKSYFQQTILNLPSLLQKKETKIALKFKALLITWLLEEKKNRVLLQTADTLITWEQTIVLRSRTNYRYRSKSCWKWKYRLRCLWRIFWERDDRNLHSHEYRKNNNTETSTPAEEISLDELLNQLDNGNGTEK